MSEFPNLGKHCDRTDCHKLDFLPFNCSHCHKTYCLDHHMPDQHGCSVDITQTNVMPKCPICNAFIHIALNESPDLKLNQHIDSGCTKHLFLDAEKQRQKERSAHLHCDAAHCKNPNNFSTIICKGCGKQFCLTHRMAEDHKCSNPPDPRHSSHGPASKSSLLNRFTGTSASGGVSGSATVKSHASTKLPQQQKQSQQTVPAAAVAVAAADTKLDAKSNTSSAAAAAATASKPADSKSLEKERKDREREHKKVQQQLTVERLKLKSKAVGEGSIPEQNRVFFSIRYPTVGLDGGAAPKLRKSAPSAMFFDQNWTVGKVLDQITKASDIENRNNRVNEPRLELFGARTKALLPSDISLHLLEPDLISGDALELRYVPQQIQAPPPQPVSIPVAAY